LGRPVFKLGTPLSAARKAASGIAFSVLMPARGMAANRSGLLMSTIRNLLMAWVLPLPAAIALSGGCTGYSPPSPDRRTATWR
jgi:PiT family inorganic phosphate transporter